MWEMWLSRWQVAETHSDKAIGSLASANPRSFCASSVSES
jgi:hypothetical protein